MRLSWLELKNFRGIACAKIELHRDITVLIGENNTGKTTILDALRLCLDAIKSDKASNFTEFDFYRDSNCKSIATCHPITLTLAFIESNEHPWPEHITQGLNEVIVGSDYSLIKLRVTGRIDPDFGEISQSWCFLDDAGNEMVGKNGHIKDLRRLRPFFFQTALRAAKDAFHGQSTYWASFLKHKDIDEATRKALEDELLEVNRKIVDAHASFKQVTEEVKRISELVAVGNVDDSGSVDAVTVDPAPSDVYRSLRYGTEINLLTASNARIPVRSHGEGTQSLSVLLLFSAYLKTRLQADIDKQAEPIIAIEEPEAHLHPNATRAVWQLLKDLPGQKIVATHSGDILSEVALDSLRRMNRHGPTTECTGLPANLLTPEELRKFNYHVRRNRGELLFARTWMLVEGETDASVFTECADLLDVDFHRLGIRIVECSQAGGPGIFIKVADALGISWHLVADGDEGGAKHVQEAQRLIGKRDETKHISKLSTPNIDILLCNAGYGSPYLDGVVTQSPGTCSGSWDDVLAEMKKTYPNKPGQALRVARKLEDRSQPEINAPADTPEYWGQVYRNLNRRFSKPAAAMQAVLLMRKNGKPGVPKEIVRIITQTHALLGEGAA